MDDRFEIVNQVVLGLVCFRLKGSNNLNQRLLSSINASGQLHMVPASLDGKFVIRFCVCAQRATEDDMESAYQIISHFAADLLEILKIDEKMRREEEEYQARTVETQGEEQQVREEDESVDEVFVLDRKKKMSLRYKRSFFVRMVSDPKLYNHTKIVSRDSATRSTSDKDTGNISDDGVVSPL